MIGYVGLIVGTLTFLVLVIRFCIETYTERGWQKDDFSTLLDYFIIGVTVLVVAVPEGLPLAVTLALAFSMTQVRGCSERTDMPKVIVGCACPVLGRDGDGWWRWWEEGAKVARGGGKECRLYSAVSEGIGRRYICFEWVVATGDEQLLIDDFLLPCRRWSRKTTLCVTWTRARPWAAQRPSALTRLAP